MMRDDHEFKVAKFASDNDAFKNTIVLSKKFALPNTSIVGLTQLKHPSPVYYPVIFDETITDNTIYMSALVRSEFGTALNSYITARLVSSGETKTIDKITFEVRSFKPVYKGFKTMTAAELQKIISDNLTNYPLTPGQILLLPYFDSDFKGGIEVKVVKVGDKTEYNQSKISPEFFKLTDLSKMEFQQSALSNIMIESTSQSSKMPKSFSLDFSEKGIGGLTDQLEQIVREVFLSRALPSEYAKAYGEKFNSNGILLYGPPGTGKTLIARTIGSFFTKDKVKVVNGPELKNKFVGQSQENLRNLFADAEKEWAQKGVNSDLYVIIFDEIDALCPVRGTHSGSIVDDDMVGQLLTMLDGVNSPRNVIIIGTTNRKDLIDPALLRQGRLGIVLEIGLPDENARNEIFAIHTKQLAASGLLDSDVDLKEWARKTKNYTGAEIEQLVTKAKHYAMANNFDLTTKTELVLKDNIKSKKELEKITQTHFLQAYSEMVPLFGVDNQFQKFKNNHFISYNKELTEIISKFNESIVMLKNTNSMNRLQILITGDSGVGKTDLAMYLAQLSGAEYIKMLTPELISTLSLDKQLSMIDAEFYKAKRADFSAIILDDFDSLLGADAEYRGYNNILRLKYEAMLKNISQSDNKCVIIATSSSKQFMERMKLLNLFNETSDLKPVRLKNLSSPESTATLKNLCESLGYQFVPSIVKTNDNREIKLPIRSLVYEIEKFCSSKDKHNTLDVDAFYAVIQMKSGNQSDNEIDLTVSSPVVTLKQSATLFAVKHEEDLHQADVVIQKKII